MKKLMVVLLVFVMAVAVGCGSSKSSSDKPSSAQTQAQTQVVPTLGMTPSEFKTKYNSFAKSINLSGDYLINGNLKMSSGSVNDTFKYSFNKNFALVGTIDKASGKIKELTLIATPKDKNEAMDMFIYQGIIIGVNSPKLSSDERGNVFRDLGYFDEGAEIYNLNKSTVRDKIKYTVQSSKEIGIWFIASAND